MLTSQESDALQQLTVIIPTMNRQTAVRAAVRQWKDVAAKIIVMDSSADSSAADYASLPGVVYRHLVAPLWDRYWRAAEMIRTPFGMLQSDDDVFVPKAIAHCINLLSEKSDYSAISPTAIKGGEPGWRLCYGQSVSWSNHAESTTDRLLHLGSNYLPSSIYGVCRSEWMRTSFSSMTAGPLPVFAFAELHHEFVLNALGKVCVLPEVGWLRRTTYDKISPATQFPSQAWYRDLDSQYRRQFVDGVAQAVAPILGEPIVDVRQSVDDALVLYAHSVAQNNSGSARRTLRQRVKAVYKQRIPEWARALLKPTIGKILSGSRKYKSWQDLSDDLDRLGIRLPPEAAVALQARERLEAQIILGER